ncbi:MAG: phage integrase SAM-like domain-containing protein [Alistipes indistinctus]
MIISLRISNYSSGKQIPSENVTVDWLKRYEKHLRKRKTTRRSWMRMRVRIRAGDYERGPEAGAIRALRIIRSAATATRYKPEKPVRKPLRWNKSGRSSHLPTVRKRPSVTVIFGFSCICVTGSIPPIWFG